MARQQDMYTPQRVDALATEHSPPLSRAAPSPVPAPTLRQVPSVGHQVHYLAHGSADRTTYAAGVPRAAIVTQVLNPGDPESAVGLAVLNPSGMFFNLEVPFGTAPGCWMWPEYVPPVAAAP